MREEESDTPTPALPRGRGGAKNLAPLPGARRGGVGVQHTTPYAT